MHSGTDLCTSTMWNVSQASTPANPSPPPTSSASLASSPPCARIALQAQPAGIGKRLEARCLTKTTILPTPRILWVGRIVKGLNVCNRNLFYNYFLSLNRLSLLFPGNNVHAWISTNRQLSRFLTRRHALLLQLTA